MSSISVSITSKVHCISEDNGDCSKLVEVLFIGSPIDIWLTAPTAVLVVAASGCSGAGVAAGSGVVASVSGAIVPSLQAPNQDVYITKFLMRCSILIWH